jgi:hypothetical protein
MDYDEPDWHRLNWGDYPAFEAAALIENINSPSNTMTGFKTCRYNYSIRPIDLNKYHIEVNQNGEKCRFNLDVYYSTRRGMEAPYFLCSVSGAECATLYCIAGILVAREALKDQAVRDTLSLAWRRQKRLAFLQGRRGFLSSQMRGRLIQELKLLGPGDSEEAKAILAAADKKDRIAAERLTEREAAQKARDRKRAIKSAARRRERRRLAKDALGAWVGRQNAKALGLTHRSAAAVLGWDPKVIGVRQGLAFLDVGLERLNEPRAALEDHIRVDVRTWYRERRLMPGKRRVDVLAWDLPSGAQRMELSVDLRAGSLPYLFLRFTVDGIPHIQRFQVVLDNIGRRIRPSLICPVTGRKVEVIAFRGGRFASAYAQHLVSRSQIRAPKDGLTVKKPHKHAQRG